jgi:clan AA aspartic protease (TIGR02281 family)
MNPKLLACLFALLVTISFSRAADKSPDEVLTANELMKFGPFYVLDADFKLSESLRNLRKAQAEVEAYAAKRKAREADIARSKNYIVQWGREQENINQQMTNTKDTREYNRLVGELNARSTRITEAAKFIEKTQVELGKMTPPAADPISATLNLAEQLEAAQAHYEKVAASEDVKNAIAKLNDGSKIRLRLGPTDQFKTELAKLRKQRDVLNAGVIRFVIEGGVPTVRATINGTVNTSMVVDSGAALVTLTADIAKQASLEPKKDDEEVTLTVADGKQVKARLTTIASLRVGQYLAKDVVVAILPETAGAATCLLGGTFLKQFTYNMDLVAKVLRLAPISEQASIVADPSAQATSPTLSHASPTSRPAGAAARVTLELSAVIDGGEAVEVTASGLKWKHTEYGWPTDVHVNGETWNPQKNQTLASDNVLKLLQSADFGGARSIEKKGRGVIAMEPTDDGLTIYFVDIAPGADRYSIKVSLPEK